MSFENYPSATCTIASVPARISTGSAILDTGWAPYGQADITIPIESAEFADAISPRDKPRVVVNARVQPHADTMPVLRQNWWSDPTPAAVGAVASVFRWGTHQAHMPVTLDGGTALVTCVTTNATEPYILRGSLWNASGAPLSAGNWTLSAAVSRAPGLPVPSAQVWFHRVNGSQISQKTFAGVEADGRTSWAIQAPAETAFVAVVLRRSSGGHVAGDWYRISKTLLEQGTSVRSYFSGATPNQTVDGRPHAYSWVGTPNLSPSIERHSVTEEGSARTFDMVLRDREINHVDKTVRLILATDEALLQTYALIADDQTPRDHESSLRTIVNYVLNETIPGAALEPGTADLDLTAQWNATNLLKNPNAASVGNWTQGGGNTIAHNTGAGNDGTPGFVRATQTAAAGAVFLCSTTYDLSAREGQMFTASVYAKHSTTGATAMLTLRFLDAANGTITNVSSAVKPVPTAWGERWTVTAVAPPNAAKVAPFISIYGSASGRTWDLDQAMLTEGPLTYPYFDGNTADTAAYTYEWADTPNESTSTRTATPERMPELFTWRAGVSAWDFLQSLISLSGLRLWCDEMRRWWLIDPAEFSVPGRVSVTPANTTEGTDRITLDGEGTNSDGVLVRYVWSEKGVERVAIDTAGTNGKIYQLTIRAPYPGPGAAAAVLKRIRNRERMQEVTTAADYGATPGKEVSISLPSALDQVGRITRTTWLLEQGLMEIQTATLTTAEPGTWLLGYDGLTWSETPDAHTWATA